MLEKIPVEILMMIVAEITGTKDLRSLFTVSKRIREAMKPLLYETVTFRTFNPDFRGPSGVGDYDLCETGRPQLNFTKHLCFSNSCRGKYPLNCPHHDIKTSKDLPETKKMINILERSLLVWMETLTEGKLREFSWHLGICVPQMLMGPEGYLPMNQKHIETFSLITDPSCRYIPDEFPDGGENFMDFSEFKHIRSFSWIGMASEWEFEALQKCLEGNAQQLESLTLTPIDSSKDDSAWYIDLASVHGPARPLDFIASYIFKFKEGLVKAVFPSLVSLSLSNVSFRKTIRDIATGLNFGHLRKLKLWHCPHALSLLSHIAQSNQCSKLISFEFVSSTWFDNSTDEERTSGLVTFLEAFEGLEDLYILFEGSLCWESIAEAATTHQRTLRRCVLHSRIYDGGSYSGETLDYALNWNPGLEYLLSLSQLECVGLCTNIESLYMHLSSLSDRPSFKILHIRASALSQFRNGSWCLDYESTHADEDEDEDIEAEDMVIDVHEGSHNENYNAEIDSLDDRETHRNTLTTTNASENEYKHKSEKTPMPLNFSYFAKWVFGPTGLRNLQVLAFGDFSHEGRYEKHNFLLCRNKLFSQNAAGHNPPTLPFRNLSKSDESLSELVKIHADFLGACAVDTIV